MWTPSLPLLEFVFRGAFVYVFLFAILRITGKRQIGQLAAFDLVLLLVLSNAVQNSMNGGDTSLLGGLISAATLVALNHAVGIATYKSKKLALVLEGRPEVLIHNGKLFPKILEEASLTRHEVAAALRQAGCTSISEVHTAILENNGVITVTQRKAPAPGTSPVRSAERAEPHDPVALEIDGLTAG